MFETVVEKFVKTVGDDLFLPSPSLAASDNLAPLGVLERRASKWVFGRDKHYTSEFCLKDLLTSEEPEVWVCYDTIDLSVLLLKPILLNDLYTPEL